MAAAVQEVAGGFRAEQPASRKLAMDILTAALPRNSTWMQLDMPMMELLLTGILSGGNQSTLMRPPLCCAKLTPLFSRLL